MPSFYWHDYETWGADPSRDRASQFAGVRTDEALNIIGEPLVIYNRPAPDVVPQPDACLITGITPQHALEQGLAERDFIAAIHQQLSQPGTCGVGYNSIRFDDEVTRYTLYRNFHDAYAREWQNGNSRWDLIDVVRLCCALRPEGIEWPIGENGQVSFKLELLTAANGLSHESAHDALSDVLATIDLARLIRREKPKLFDYAYGLRKKAEVARLLDINRQKPVLHVSSRYPAGRFCSALVMPLMQHPVNKNSIIAYDLMVDPAPLLELGVSEIARRVFSAQADLPEGVNRIPLKEIHLNRSPMVASMNLLDSTAQERLQIDLGVCERNWQSLFAANDLSQKLAALYSDRNFESESDPDRMLYSGGFFSTEDKQLMQTVVKSSASELAQNSFPFTDSRLSELLFRYRGRNFADSLSEEERGQWLEYCHQRIHDENGGGSMTAEQCLQRIAVLRGDGNLDEHKLGILSALEIYVKNLP